MDKETCKNPALFRYTWAGHPEAVCCLLHAHALRTIANAIAYQIQLIQVSEADMLSGLGCSHRDDLPSMEDSNE